MELPSLWQIYVVFIKVVLDGTFVFWYGRLRVNFTDCGSASFNGADTGWLVCVLLLCIDEVNHGQGKVDRLFGPYFVYLTLEIQVMRKAVPFPHFFQPGSVIQC